jgi:hypothetical protein
MRQYPTDFRLWGLIFGCLFSPIAAISIFIEGVGRLDRFVEDMLILAVGCAVVAWILHAAAVICGVRLTRTVDPTPAADYDDAPAPPPAR